MLDRGGDGDGASGNSARNRAAEQAAEHSPRRVARARHWPAWRRRPGPCGRPARRIAWRARLLAVRAFGTGPSEEATTFAILVGLDWAIEHGARIVNMSFAGPAAPALQEALAKARKKGVVLIAAAGNAGPKSPPLYPAADPNVIAVTATDADDRLFAQANRGSNVAL